MDVYSPRCIRPYELAEQQMRVVSGGQPIKFDGSLTPYMREPVNATIDRTKKAVILVASSQAGKTTGLLGTTLHYNVLVSKKDALYLQPTQSRAADYSVKEFDRLCNINPEMNREVVSGRSNSQSRKPMASGAYINLEWPTQNTLSGRPYPLLAYADYDRCHTLPDGPVFNLMLQRSKSFGNDAMIICESSPSVDCLVDSDIEHAHDFPMVEGIISLYMQGTQKRWYIKCPDCSQHFSPASGPEALHIPGEGSIAIRAAAVRLPCTNCGSLIEQRHYNPVGEWRPRIDEDGNTKQSDIDSYALPGVCAAFSNWEKMAGNYLNAQAQFNLNSDQSSLRAVTNTEFGGVFIPRIKGETIEIATFLERTIKLDKGIVPRSTESIVMTVDPGKHMVDFAAIAILDDGKLCLVDRFKLRYSKRPKKGGEAMDDGQQQNELIQLGSFIEDWNVMHKYALNREYKLPNGDILLPSLVACDSGGADNTFHYAQQFKKSLLMLGQDVSRRFMLVKGASNLKDLAKETISDTGVRYHLLNVHELKNRLSGRLERDDGPHSISYSHHIPHWAYDELQGEVLNEKGNWVPRKRSSSHRVETLDLMVYGLFLETLTPKPRWGGKRGKLEQERLKQLNRQRAMNQNQPRYVFDTGV